MFGSKTKEGSTEIYITCTPHNTETVSAVLEQNLQHAAQHLAASYIQDTTLLEM